MNLTVEKPKKKIDKRILREHYRNYDLISRHWKNEYRGRVLKHHKIVLDIVGDDVESIIHELRTYVDEQIQEKTNQRKGAEPPLSELESAIYSVWSNLSEEQRKILKSHANRPNRIINMLELQQIGRYRSSTDAMLDYADISRKLCDELGYEPESSAQKADVSMLTPSMAILLEAENDEPFLTTHWKMQQQIAKLIIQL